MSADILKIQRAVRKSIKDYSIESKHEEEALVVLISVDLYLALEERDVPPAQPKSRVKPPVVLTPVQE